MNREQIKSNVTLDAAQRFAAVYGGPPTPGEMGQWFMDNLEFLAPHIKEYLDNKEDENND